MGGVCALVPTNGPARRGSVHTQPCQWMVLTGGTEALRKAVSGAPALQALVAMAQRGGFLTCGLLFQRSIHVGQVQAG